VLRHLAEIRDPLDALAGFGRLRVSRCKAEMYQRNRQNKRL
jgi:hypothetical protein